MIEKFTELIGNGKSKLIELAPHDVLAVVPCGPFTEVYISKKRTAILDIPYKEFREKFVQEQWHKTMIYSEGEL
jgi:hypothetical protein